MPDDENTIDYALLSDDLDTELHWLRQVGVTVDRSRSGGRTQPDGQEIAWKTIGVEDEGAPLPVVPEDVTDLDLRVPPGPTRR